MSLVLGPLRQQVESVICFSVGKTSLMNQYVNKRFSNQYKATIGADLYELLLYVVQGAYSLILLQFD
jgi:Ras family